MRLAGIRHFWQQISRTRCARALEAELARVLVENSRLRDENRALLNSILGIAGIPPVHSNSAEEPRSLPSPRAGLDAPVPGPATPSVGHASAPFPSQVRPPNRSGKNPAQLSPLRRRSWHQVNRALEFKAARKSPQDGAER
jgi:hypothetical protein